MNLTPTIRRIMILAGAVLSASLAFADIVETKNGARLVGKVIKVDGGSVYLTTDYAGDLVIKQSEVTSLTTDAPIVVRLASGTVLQGTLATDAGALKISGRDGQLTTQVDKVAATWPVGAEDPLVVSLRRHWKYEAAVDITGKSGNSSQQGTAGSFRATLKAPQDTLQLYTAYDRQVTDGSKSADQFKAGIDYANNFSGKKSWYTRDEGGFDRIKDIDLYNTAAAGLGYDFVKEAKHLITGRLGVAYRYEDYGSPARANLSAMGLDAGLNFEWEFTDSKFVDRMTWVPSFNDFSNYRFTNEAFYEIPLANPAWKVRLGVSNDYTSKPGAGLKSMDTIYFTRLVLDWE
jgi:putative salt-induced outer membrane protein YdiY